MPFSPFFRRFSFERETFFQRKKGGENFFRVKKRGAKTFLDAKKVGRNFLLPEKKGGGKFFHRGKILKTRPGYPVNFDRSLRNNSAFKFLKNLKNSIHGAHLKFGGISR